MTDDATATPAPAAPRGTTIRRRRVRRLLAGVAIASVAGLVSTEGFLRIRYGLGNPPVLISDSATEYRARPDGHYRRLGNRIDYNAYSMRSDPIAPTKAAGERRVLVLGDSIINGGAQTDQPALATSLLQDRLRRDVAPQAYVGNVSAGSWGPQNLLGYVRSFGWFEADVVVIVASSHDAFDEIGVLPTRSGVPSQTYRLALGEAWDRLSPRFFAGTGAGATAGSGEALPNRSGESAPCLTAFGELIDSARAAGATVLVAFHFERAELDATSEPDGHRLFRQICAARGIEPISLAPAFRAQLAAGHDPYRDTLHPNTSGQLAIADALTDAIESALRAPATPTTGATTRPR